MNVAQRQKLGMYQLVTEYGFAHPVLLRHYPELDLALQCFHTLISSVAALEQQEQQVMTGRPADPEKAGKTICALAASISAMIIVYADEAQDDDLKKNAHYAYHTLRRCSDKTLLRYCKDIYAKAMKLLPVLQRYDVLKESVEVLSGAIQLYNTVVPPPKNPKALNRHYRKRFDFFMREAALMIKTKLDPLVKPFFTADREFFNGYMELRQLGKKQKVLPAA